MRNEILEILNDIKPEVDFSNSNAFVDEELLDSFDIVSLVGLLEERYAITIDGLDIIPENFQKVDDIIDLVNKSKKAQ